MSHPDDYVHMVPEPKYQEFLAYKARIEELYAALAGRDEDFYETQDIADKLTTKNWELEEELRYKNGLVRGLQTALRGMQAVVQSQSQHIVNFTATELWRDEG